ncbi:MAG TPA: D-2-hydroxyacid dehydrogenase [Rhizobiaceae bacterium]|nr:D-2-hydroxyacid dehydrogenase [Rhizobiaceae bacterium]
MAGDLVRDPALMVSRTDGSAIAPRMVEYVLGAIYATTQQFPRAWAQARDRAWRPYLVGRASGKVVGVAGLGDIGALIALALNRNGMRVVGWRRSKAPLPDGVDKVYHGADELPAFASACDFLVSVLPATDQTKRIFDADIFAAMKREAVFINVGRGHSVDEDALADALEGDVIAGAVLDVFEREPLPTESRLWGLKNLTITPHVSGPLLPEDVISSFLENLARFRAGQPLHKLVDRRRGY